MKEPERLPKKNALAELQDWIPEIMDHDLTLKQMRFLVAYIGNNFNATAAYNACDSVQYAEEPATKAEAEVRRKAASKKGCGMLQSSKIQAALADYMKAFIGENKDKLEYRILNQIILRAFYDPFDIITETGKLRPLDEIPDDHRQLILGVETQLHPKDVTVETVKVKLACRDKARQELQKYINMLNTHTNVTTLKLEEGVREQLKKFLGDKPSGDIKPPSLNLKKLIHGAEG